MSKTRYVLAYGDRITVQDNNGAFVTGVWIDRKQVPNTKNPAKLDTVYLVKPDEPRRPITWGMYINRVWSINKEKAGISQ